MEAAMTATDNSYVASGVGTYGDFIASPGKATQPAIWGFLTAASQARFSVGGLFSGWYWGVQGLGGSPDNSGRVGPPPNDFSSSGVFGTGVNVTGVAGTSVDNVGIYGQTDFGLAGNENSMTLPNRTAGVNGAATAFGAGVVGWSTYGNAIEGFASGGSALLALSDTGWGVQAHSRTADAVSATSANNAGIRGLSDRANTAGPTIPLPVTMAGVIGTSSTVHGVIGTSRSNAGVVGYSANGVGIVGMTSNPASSAGAFFGDVRVAGNIYANNLKSAVVPFPDGSRRALYCMESPDLWFEDFGKARLARGRAVVKLDANFAKVIKRGDYGITWREGIASALGASSSGQAF
jgi:hypothetical protein